MLTPSASIFDRLRRRWMEVLGPERLRELEDDLETIVGALPKAKITGLPGWLHWRPNGGGN